nr:GSCFA domain-containing protein [Caulobacter sp. S45]
MGGSAHSVTQETGVAYFPSYEVVTSPTARGAYFRDDLRSVTQTGVDHVMHLFFHHIAAEGAATPTPPARGWRSSAIGFAIWRLRPCLRRPGSMLPEAGSRPARLSKLMGGSSLCLKPPSRSFACFPHPPFPTSPPPAPTRCVAEARPLLPPWGSRIGPPDWPIPFQASKASPKLPGWI